VRRRDALVLVGGLALAAVVMVAAVSDIRSAAGPGVALPAPLGAGALAVEQALAQRRSVREFRAEPLELARLSQLLWAAQGVRADGHRTAPSAGALYPLEIYVLAGRVPGLEAGVFRYVPAGHRLDPVATGDRRAAAAQAAGGQSFLAAAPAVIVVAADERRTSGKYGGRATRYVDFEAGAAAENLALEAVALGLGTVVVGSFDDARMAQVAGLRPGERPVVLMPVGAAGPS
jgi:SagB-type dehydrogenase family enzyme